VPQGQSGDPGAKLSGNVSDLETSGFALAHRSAEKSEGFEKERSDEVWLELAGLGPFHLVTNAFDIGDRHHVVNEGPLVDHGAQSVADGRVDYFAQLCLSSWVLAVADGLNK